MVKNKRMSLLSLAAIFGSLLAPYEYPSKVHAQTISFITKSKKGILFIY
jgi:hypothetical protein